jgi:hypothetical protein
MVSRLHGGVEGSLDASVQVVHGVEGRVVRQPRLDGGEGGRHAGPQAVDELERSMNKVAMVSRRKRCHQQRFLATPYDRV